MGQGRLGCLRELGVAGGLMGAGGLRRGGEQRGQVIHDTPPSFSSRLFSLSSGIHL